MGCVSSNLLSNEESFTQLGGSALGVGHHIVSLTSTTYGLLNLDPPSTTTTTPPAPPPRFTLASVFPAPLPESPAPNPDRTPLWSQPSPFRSDPPQEVINSWELMSGLDPVDSFRFSPLPSSLHKKNSNPNFPKPPPPPPQLKESPNSGLLEGFEELCPPNGENRVVIYTTSLRGIRKTFEACSAVRAAIESFGVQICERDVSMDRGFKEELKELMIRSGDDDGCSRKGGEDYSAAAAIVLPRVFVKGRYLGGVEEVMKVVEEGGMADLLQGLPRSKACCEGCGNLRFLPCSSCNGSCKVVMVVKEKETDNGEFAAARSVVVRCPDCNENGLVVCPICS